ncbi:hypothetical protein [Pseudonocardia yuanmonensis]|uniref:hypothetical protein n=1 Tax=Pseudonocardia yuanmonensis TaxID=1095914 RepID=UPI0031EA24CA
MRRLPLLVAGSVLAALVLVFAGVLLLGGRGGAPTGVELAPISVPPAGPAGSPAPTATPDPGGTVPPPPAGDRDDDTDDDTDDDIDGADDGADDAGEDRDDGPGDDDD